MINPAKGRKRRFGFLQKKSSKKRALRASLLTGNILILAVVIWFISNYPSTANPARQSIIANSNGTSEASVANPLDQLSSADIAVHIARMARLAEADSVTTNAISVNAQLTITPADDKVVAKPQVVTTALKSKKDIQKYTTKSGDTISNIAAKFNVTSDSIRWSNGLTGDTIAAGKELTIPPVTGIVYTVKQGDTAENLASKFKANKDQIIAFNDAEVSGLRVGDQIVIPDGIQQVVRPAVGTVATGGFAWGGFSPVYGYNGYDYGYCTWWAAVRRQQVGKPIPSNLGNASTWKVLSQRAGLAVGNTPQQYAVIWTPPRDYYGHVGFVEAVNADGSVYISEMNTVGWNRVSYKTLTAQQAAAYSYIY